MRWRRFIADPALMTAIYIGGGLLWVLGGDPLLSAWLAGAELSPMLGPLANALLIAASGGLLYRLLSVHVATARHAHLVQDTRLAEFIETIADVAFIKDRDGRYLLFNSAGARLVGKPLTECLGQDDRALFPADMALKLMETNRQVIANGHLLNREDTFDIGGDRRILQSTQWPYRDADDRIIGVIGIARDITAQKQAEEQAWRTRDELESRVRERTAELVTANRTLERLIAARVQTEIALRDSEERFRQLAEHIREVFWVYGIVEERLLYVSPAYAEIWGRAVRNFQERPLDWLEAVHPDDRPRIQAAHAAKLESGRFDEEYRIVRPDGAVRWIWDRGFPIHDATGHVYRIAGLAEDITTRKLAEDQLRRQQVELAKMSRLSLAVELASNLAHELNQPLAAIVAYTQACLTLLREDTADPRELTGTLEEVVNQGLRAGGIIRHLRGLVQKHPAAQTEVDLNALIRAVMHYAQLELRQADITVRLELTEPLPAILADDMQIQLVVLYLVRNAIEAMQDADDAPRELLLRTAPLDTGTVLATVLRHRTGLQPGSARTIVPTLFHHQVRRHGTGAVGQSLADRIPGRAIVGHPQSARPWGLLPFQPAGVHSLPTIARARMNEIAPTVFLIDDDQAVRDAVGLLLRATGLIVESFASATDFLKSADGIRRPGCLLLDVRMPGMSGLDLQKQLQEQGHHIPIIFMTGHGDIPMATRAMKAGAFDFIEKPFQGQTLLARVREALERDARELRRQAQRSEAARRLARLSPREREVLERVAAGQYNKVIAAELGISLSTVEIHRKRVMEKLEADSLSNLIRTLALLNEGGS
jgi:PAS domain S-box-containing protein